MEDLEYGDFEIYFFDENGDAEALASAGFGTDEDYYADQDYGTDFYDGEFI